MDPESQMIMPWLGDSTDHPVRPVKAVQPRMTTARRSRNQIQTNLNAETQRTPRNAKRIKLCASLRSRRLCVGKFAQENETLTDSSTDGPNAAGAATTRLWSAPTCRRFWEATCRRRRSRGAFLRAAERGSAWPASRPSSQSGDKSPHSKSFSEMHELP
jgi:hypothetical protein